MKTLLSSTALKEFVKFNKKQNKSIAFVPTMGALHDGHLELVRQGLKRCDVCIPYIFVNPKQFAPTEDLAAYPRMPEEDAKKLEASGAHALYLPRPEEIYPEGFVTSVKVGGAALPLEGEFRPVMFDGVATVLTKMFLQCLPDVALFGEKDYQQLQVIKKFVRDLDIPVEIIGVPTVREKDGLALSSRNAYLTPEERKTAPILYKALKDMREKFLKGEEVAAIEKDAREALLQSGFSKVDYITIRNAETLLPPDGNSKSLRILAAAWLGKARLIDNIAI
jgi:pantoate--beta-alanine ligase